MKQKYITAVLTAAGTSRRMGAGISKQFLKIGNKMIIQRTIDIFDNMEEVDDIILIVRKDDINIYEKEILPNVKKPIKLVIGGNTREESTYNGILALDEKTDIVVCHDGVRPFIKPNIIIKAIEEMENNNAAIVAVPSKDTIKYADKNGFVEYTPNRDRLYNVQTPQVFKKDILIKAYENVFDENIKVTDDSSLLEMMGEKVQIIIGDYSNIKITTKEDLLYGELILKQEEEIANRFRI